MTRKNSFFTWKIWKLNFSKACFRQKIPGFRLKCIKLQIHFRAQFNVTGRRHTDRHYNRPNLKRTDMTFCFLIKARKRFKQAGIGFNCDSRALLFMRTTRGSEGRCISFHFIWSFSYSIFRIRSLKWYFFLLLYEAILMF